LEKFKNAGEVDPDANILIDAVLKMIACYSRSMASSLTVAAPLLLSPEAIFSLKNCSSLNIFGALQYRG